MIQFMKSLLCTLLIAAMVLSLCACGSSSSDILDKGADKFASGKKEDSYHLKNSGALLDELIKKYSGSYQIPDKSKMDDASFAAATQPDPTAPTDGSAPEDTRILIRNWSEFLDMLYDTYYATADEVIFDVAPGYSLDLSVDLQASFTELQRQDPIYVGSVKSWTYGQQGNTYVLQITYTMPVDELIAIKDATRALVEDAVAQIDTTGKSDYELVCAVNDYLCDVTYYPPTEPYAPVTHTAYGALKNGVAVCEGYACAAKLMLNKLGIPCDIQVGTCIGGGGHGWNLVQLDGQWYQLDVTWNDQSASREDYLLVNDSYMQKSRTWEYSNYPACPNPYTP